VIKFLFRFIVCFAIHSPLFAQNNNSDSLKKLLDNYAPDDTVKVMRLYQYARSLPDSQAEMAFRYIEAGKHIADKINSPYFSASGYLHLSHIYGQQNMVDSAASLLIEGLNEAEKFHLDGLLFQFNNNLGETYCLLNDLKKAEYYDDQALDRATSQKNQHQILSALRNLILLANMKEQWDKLDSLASIALPLASALKESGRVADIDMNQGDAYRSSHKYKEAINKYKAALKIFKQQLNNHGLAFTYCLLSAAFVTLDIKDSARWYAEAAIATTTKYDLKKEKNDAHEALFNYYNHFKDYKNALEEKFILDSLENERNTDKVSKITFVAEMRYNQEKKDLLASVEQQKKDAEAKRIKNLQYLIMDGLGIAVIAVLLIAGIQYRNNRQKKKANGLLQQQKQKVESTLDELKSTQAQLIQSEKMASLGELTAGVAHEIQNPLNFVNNFSEVNRELIQELQTELKAGNKDQAITISNDIKANEQKINQHGKRADAIVKGMLQHSRSSKGAKEPTDINALADEYLRLAYHGLRAKDNSFVSTIKTDFDANIRKINIIPQDIGRVLLNLCNNAFYAVNEKKRQHPEGYEPTVLVSTRKSGNQIVLSVKDNGNGIPQHVIDKIFQPFFTTKPTGQGTGLGLSLSYDIVKAYGGEIRVNTKEGEFTEFAIQLPETA
jgi:two-component system, NtrC family, sensor kinase